MAYPLGKRDSAMALVKGEGLSYAEASRVIGVSKSSVRRWAIEGGWERGSPERTEEHYEKMRSEIEHQADQIVTLMMPFLFGRGVAVIRF